MTSVRRDFSFNKTRDSIGSISTLSFQLPAPPDAAQRQIRGHLILALEVCTLACILVVVYFVPAMMIRLYKFNGTISEGTLLYKESFEDKSWMVHEFPKAVDDMFVMLNRSITRILNETSRMDTLNDERRRFMAFWHDAFTVYPLIITFLIMAIALHIFIRIHPEWAEVATEAPTFGEMILLIAAMLFQLTLIFNNVRLHRQSNKFLKELSVLCSDALSDPISQTEPLTFCMAPANDFSTFLLLSLFVNLMVIYSIMDYLDST
nr:unnamed protein product [Spirometra erinaceieuropaei]